MPTNAPAAIFTVKDGFVGDYGKGSMAFPAGERFASDHPAVKKWPQFFRAEVRETIEQATAAPGEKRGA